jgi:hypothetical protein
MDASSEHIDGKSRHKMYTSIRFLGAPTVVPSTHRPNHSETSMLQTSKLVLHADINRNRRRIIKVLDESGDPDTPSDGSFSSLNSTPEHSSFQIGDKVFSSTAHALRLRSAAELIEPKFTLALERLANE